MAPADVRVGDVVVCVSGNLGHIYLTCAPERMHRTDIEARYPGLIDGLVAHPGIGLVVVGSADGPIALGRHGTRWLDDGRVSGTDPVAAYGSTAAEGLRRVASFVESGDIVAIGALDPDTGHVVSFEELIGSHGGLGGRQDDAFIAYPGTWSTTGAPLIGAPAIHDLLRRWLAVSEASGRGAPR